MDQRQRATRNEIFEHLRRILGNDAVDAVLLASLELKAGHKQEGLDVLTAYDAALGGIGIYTIKDKKPLGVSRALFYVWLPLQGEQPENHTRGMIQVACGYLEELLKKMVRQWPWEKIRVEGAPLGALVHRARKQLPPALADELVWLSGGVYNFAKHHFNFEEDQDQAPEHYFSLDEALAVYLIVRKLGLELEKHFLVTKNVSM